VKVRYLETVTSTGDAEGRHKKQSGGRGQFGVASVRIEPLERGGGFVFESAVVGGAIPTKFIPSVEKGVAEAMQRGGVHGYPVIDVKATVYDGKFHNVDSDEMSFKTAGRLAFRDAMAQAGPVVLEPISKLEVTVPMTSQGDIMGDLNARRGRVQGTDMSGPDEQTIVALVPTSEILRYAIDLRSMTGGRGRFRVEHDHYDVLPSHLLDAVSQAVHHDED
jgi:elongation factor G